MSRKSTLNKVKRELERRLQRLAQGLPVSDTYSDKKVPTRFWTQTKWGEGKRLLTFKCECGKEHRIELRLHARKVFYRLVDRIPGRARHKGVIEKNLQKGDLTKAKLEGMIEGHFYEPTHISQAAQRRKR